jgi:hypothetical protein
MEKKKLLPIVIVLSALVFVWQTDSANAIFANIDVEKYVSVDNRATWHDADVPPGPEVLSGSETVWFRFVMTNIGDFALTNVTLSDSDFDAAIAAQCTVPTELDVGESFECVIGSFVAVEGQHTNTATATGEYDETTYIDIDAANYRGLVMDVEKLVSVDNRDTWHDADYPPGPQVLGGSPTV